MTEISLLLLPIPTELDDWAVLAVCNFCTLENEWEISRMPATDIVEQA